jgi:hypothetical protein
MVRRAHKRHARSHGTCYEDYQPWGLWAERARAAPVAALAHDVSNGSFSTETANSAARLTSVSSRKLTSGPNEKLDAKGHEQTSPNIASPDKTKDPGEDSLGAVVRSL